MTARPQTDRRFFNIPWVDEGTYSWGPCCKRGFQAAFPDGRLFVLRRYLDTLFFKPAGILDGGAAPIYFTGVKLTGCIGPEELKLLFARQFANGNYGRCLTGALGYWNNAFFVRNETPWHQENSKDRLILCPGPEDGPLPENPRDAASEELLTFFNGMLSRRLREMEGQGRFRQWELRVGETTFLCGSREELERLTKIICYTEPGLFEKESEVEIHFEATSAENAGGPRFWIEEPSRRIQELLALAFEDNTFTGSVWRCRDRNKAALGEAFYSRPVRFEFIIPPPSAHQRAEAILELESWLNARIVMGAGPP